MHVLYHTCWLNDDACEDEVDAAVKQEAARQAGWDRRTDGWTDRKTDRRTDMHACTPADVLGLNQQVVRQKSKYLCLSR